MERDLSDVVERSQPSASLEVWLTGPDAESLWETAAALSERGGSVRSGPWDALGPDTVWPLRWSMVVAMPASTDPTWIAAVALSRGCCYHPGGGADRWEAWPPGRSPAPTVR